MGWGSGNNARRSREEIAARSPEKQRRYTFGAHSNACHVWAQQDPATWHGQSSDGRIFWEGETIYSHGRHFAMAKFVGEYKGQRVVLIRDERYSVSTSTHQRYMESSLKSSDITCSVPFWDTPNQKAWVKAAYENLLASAAFSTENWIAKRMLAIDAFRALYKVRSKRLDHHAITVWNDKRVKMEAHKEEQAKRNSAIELAKTTLAIKSVKPIDPAASSHAIKDSIYRAERLLTEWRSARLTLGKFPNQPATKHKQSLARAIKIVEAALPAYKAAESAAVDREQRDENLRKLKEIRDGAKIYDVAGLYSYEPHAPARLATFALKEGGWEDVARVLIDHIHVQQWERVVPATFKPSWTFHKTEKITRDEWLAGKGSAVFHDAIGGTIVRRKGDELQTSMGATCPWEHALKAFRVAQHCRITGYAVERDKHGTSLRVGHFNVDRIDADGNLTAGCHVLRWDAMLALAVREVPELVKPRYPLPALITLPTENWLIDYDPSQRAYVA